MTSNDVRDWLVMALISAAWVSATVFLFKHPESVNFATWAGLALTMTSSYHWMTIRDAKLPDAERRFS